MADVGVFVTKVASWEVVGEDGRKRHRGDLQPLLDISRTHQLPDRLLQLPKRVGEAYWIRHPHSPFGLAVTRILHLRYRSPAQHASAVPRRLQAPLASLALQDVYLRVHLDRRRRRLQLPYPGELPDSSEITTVSALLPLEHLERVGDRRAVLVVLVQLPGHQGVEELDQHPARDHTLCQ